ncbi:hypothetical protein B0H11DRAFT_1928537 [Mycena galericulata]|nr:hypothetical protein B0H11DRAFT_1928537 [Mycena galericulata]
MMGSGVRCAAKAPLIRPNPWNGGNWPSPSRLQLGENELDYEWDEEQQSAFIETIFRNLYIPPFVFSLAELILSAVRKELDAETGIEVADGRQRVIPIRNCWIQGRRYLVKDLQDSRREHILTEDHREMFCKKVVVCVEIPERMATDADFMERVRYSTPPYLEEVPFETIKSPHAEFIRMVVESFLDAPMDAALTWKQDNATELTSVYVCAAAIAYASTTALLPFLPMLHGWISRAEELPALAVESIKHTFSTFRVLVIDPQNLAIFCEPQALIPAEFIAIGILIARRKESVGLRQIVTEISALRKDMLKSNASVGEHYGTFMRLLSRWEV